MAAIAYQRRARGQPPGPEFVDSTGRVVVPVAQEHLADYYDIWREYCRRLDPQSIARHQARQLAEAALRCPVDCVSSMGGICSVALNAATAPEPWLKQPKNPYTPFLWRNYEIGDHEYDLVVYRRPRRSLLCKVLCCGG